MAIDATHPVPPQYPRIAGQDNIPAHVPKELVRSIGLTFGPEFLDGPLYDKDRLQAYAAADYFVYTPVEYEETSTACLEALACGVPVITTYQAAVPLLGPKTVCCTSRLMRRRSSSHACNVGGARPPA